MDLSSTPFSSLAAEKSGIPIQKAYINISATYSIIDKLYHQIRAYQRKEQAKARAEGLKGTSPIRPCHHQAMQALSYAYAIQIHGMKNRCWNSLAMPAYKTDRSSLSKLFKGCSIRSVSNYLDKLQSIGFISSRCSLGNQIGISIEINPLYLRIEDVKNLQNNSKIENLRKAEESSFLGHRVQNLQNKYKENTLNNKKIIAVSAVEKGTSTRDDVEAQSKQSLHEDTCGGKEVTKRKIDGLHGVPQISKRLEEKNRLLAQLEFASPTRAAQIKTELFERQKVDYGRWFFFYAYSKLKEYWKGAYQGNIQNAYDYVSSKYFSDCQTIDQCERRQANYKWRIDKVAEFMRKHPNYTIFYPAEYFQIGGKKGSFGYTKNWIQNHKKYQEVNAKKTEQSRRKRNVNGIIRTYFKHETIAAYKNAERQILRKYPELIGEFYKRVQEHSGMSNQSNLR